MEIKKGFKKILSFRFLHSFFPVVLSHDTDFYLHEKIRTQKD